MVLTPGLMVHEPMTGPVADPTQLPESKSGANGVPQVVESGLATQAAGYTYADGVSGVDVIKITSTTVPDAGNHHTGYPTGGPRCSQQWLNGSGKRCYTFTVLQDGSTPYFCDFNWDDGVVEDTYAMPDGGGETDHAFSLHPSRKRICYLVTGSKQFRAYDTQARAYADFGVLPVTISATGSSLVWLQTQINDAWIVGMLNSNHTVVAVNMSTGDQINCPDGTNGYAIDEPHLDLADPYCYLSVDGTDPQNAPWRLDTDTKPTALHDSDCTDGCATNDDHAAPVRGGMFGAAGQNGTYGGAYYWDRAAGQPEREWVGYAEGIADDEDFYTNGYGNAFGFQGGFGNQWALAAKFTNDGATRAIRHTVIAMFQLNSTGARKFLVGHQSNTGAGDYFEKVRPVWSPDGLLVIWTSWMMTRGGGSPQYQILACKMPVI